MGRCASRLCLLKLCLQHVWRKHFLGRAVLLRVAWSVAERWIPKECVKRVTGTAPSRGKTEHFFWCFLFWISTPLFGKTLFSLISLWSVMWFYKSLGTRGGWNFVCMHWDRFRTCASRADRSAGFSIFFFFNHLSRSNNFFFDNQTSFVSLPLDPKFSRTFAFMTKKKGENEMKHIGAAKNVSDRVEETTETNKKKKSSSYRDESLKKKT